MAKKKVVIVESPTKARTVGRFLGRGYGVVASMGHIRDLPANRFGVDVEHDFQPRYVIPADKRDVVKRLKADVKDAGAVYLATDPDREGEAISWHLIEALDLNDSRPVHRVEFHEITREAIKAAFDHPRQINLKLVEAQQARRVLDRLVGYTLSPLLRRKIPRKGLSAGRVQSVAVRLVADREREIEAFQIKEYWTIKAQFSKQGQPITGRGDSRIAPTFDAKLVSLNGNKSELNNEGEAKSVVAQMEQAAYRVGEVSVKEVRRSPAPPFTTSTLQQEAARKLRYGARRTMVIAQQLYEGIEIKGEGETGLITYMRTDSTNLAESAIDQIRGYIRAKFGPEYVPDAPRRFQKKSKLAQEAHEAIRPTSVDREPEAIKSMLTPEQYRLYRLIWQRAVASQMESALIENTTVPVIGDGKAGPVGTGLRPVPTTNTTRFELRAAGSVIKFPGFITLYSEGRDEGEEAEDEEGALPKLESGEPLNLVKILPEQRFTQPPPRYTEATLVKTLEENGIGRPSTYAPTMSTIVERGYVEMESRHFKPTQLGMVVTDLLVQHFPNIVDVGFTADLEEKLDQVADAEMDWVQLLHAFYEPFSVTLKAAEQSISPVEIAPEMAGENCEVCGLPMVIKYGRFGKFIACSGFPACKNSRSLVVKTGVTCPKCRKGDLIERRSRRGKQFFGCSEYPQCDFAVWQRPVSQPCPHCGGLVLQSGRDQYKCNDCGKLVKIEETAPAIAG